jgi:hypothetical protein
MLVNVYGLRPGIEPVPYPNLHPQAVRLAPRFSGKVHRRRAGAGRGKEAELNVGDKPEASAKNRKNGNLEARRGGY